MVFSINRALLNIESDLYQDIDDQTDIEHIIFNSKYFYGMYMLHRKIILIYLLGNVYCVFNVTIHIQNLS